MKQEQFEKEIQEAIDAADRALYCLEQARKHWDQQKAGGFMT